MGGKTVPVTQSSSLAASSTKDKMAASSTKDKM